MTIEELFPKERYPLRITTRFLLGDCPCKVDYFYQNPLIRNDKQDRGYIFRMFPLEKPSQNCALTFQKDKPLERYCYVPKQGFVEINTRGKLQKSLDIMNNVPKLLNKLGTATWRPL
ncbi:MAG: hypothetical protein HYT37_03385 [Candidatus Sungbacteria bacterium]|nr:hypothetical protein [Candidatus Sungbacteria bacterium]